MRGGENYRDFLDDFFFLEEEGGGATGLGGAKSPRVRLKIPYAKIIQKTPEKSPNNTAVNIRCRSSNGGSGPSFRMSTIWETGQAKLSNPSKKKLTDQIYPMEGHFHARRNARAMVAVTPQAMGKAPTNNHRPIITTRLPSTAFS